LIAPITDQFLMSFSRDGEHFMLLKSLGATSCIVANMTANGRMLGVLVLAMATPGRTFSQQDVNFASELTRRMAIVIDNVRLLRQAQQNNRMKDEFLASLAHELRNPLAPIRNATQLMSAKLHEPETIDKLRLMIARQVHHISRMIDDLTDVARIENGKLMLRRETVDLVSIVRDAIHSCKDLIEQKHQTLVLELPRHQIYMNGDPTRLEQIVCNLIHNAAKYTPELGTVTIQMEGYSESIIVRVKDNGMGISPRLLPRIFDSLRRHRSPWIGHREAWASD
jgi:signal transduction histidine kinase